MEMCGSRRPRPAPPRADGVCCLRASGERRESTAAAPRRASGATSGGGGAPWGCWSPSPPSGRPRPGRPPSRSARAASATSSTRSASTRSCLGSSRLALLRHMTAALAKYHHKTPLTPFGIACCGLYAAYGVRLSTYVLRRQGEDSYLPKLEALQLKSDMMGVAGKFAIVAGVSFSQALYALPLTVAMSPSAARARPALRALGWAGVGISAVGLLIREHVADEQKLAGKREKPGAPVVDGLYSYCRHPNYRNLLFHCGISCMGVSGTPMQVFACVFPTFFMGFTLQNAAVRSDKEESRPQVQEHSRMIRAVGQQHAAPPLTRRPGARGNAR
ncbi:unnamed protein product [Prorocentrum cordatum]|uniref:Protein-S-isoprenylcysteine O-methyltransferase n=2 Tax=Prorocentrum cordatum TaxID=2364126 RepID=A0ABN9UV49_9DINO|nr:unnamed protein product [Polarella glacialis]